MPKEREELVFHNDPINEQVCLAAALVDPATRASLLARLPPDTFLTPEHRVAWATLAECERLKLAYDPATVAKVSNGEVDPDYLARIAAARPDVPENLEFHVEALLWDRQRYVALTGPVSSLLNALHNPKETPDRVKGLSRAVQQTFDGWQVRQHTYDPEELIRDQVAVIKSRIAGHAVYPYGIAGLDFYDPDRARDTLHARRRLIPGSAPGQVTIITGVPGSGKSTAVARIALGLARQRRKSLIGAWEMTGGTTLELLACISLGWSRSDLTEGKIGHEQLRMLEARMREISAYVRFMKNPFRRRARGAKSSNEANLDIIQGEIADSGCDVFIADLWKRCLKDARPEEEEEALYRQQSMSEELKVHSILVQQQRLKDIEMRPDKRPTREGIKGSGAWTEIADTIIGVHRPALWKPVDDVVIEFDILKQRYGQWPLAVECDWDPDRGMISGGRSIPYDQPVTSGTAGSKIDRHLAEPKKKGPNR